MKITRALKKIKPFSLVLFLLIPVIMFAQPGASGFTIPENASFNSPAGLGKEKKDKKRKDEFKVFIGANFNQLNISDGRYSSNIGVGWDLGFAYKRGKFFYWEVGARYNNPVYTVKDNEVPADSSALFDGVFGVRMIDVPLTVGINFLSITSRIVGLRVFVSAVPTFTLGIGDNDYDLNKDDLNSFILFGQAGVGVDIAFIFLEGGFNYGFNDLFKADFQSNPYQLFLNLGFRF